MRFSPSLLRTWWSAKQGLDGSFAKAAPADVLVRSGWARSVGGCGPDLTLNSRAGIGRETADKATADLQIHELPSARGCTYVVPTADFAIALKAGQGSSQADMRIASKLGVTEQEVDKLCRTVMEALKDSPLESEGIRAAVVGAARSLGEAGKEKGFTTTLPLALGSLQENGEIRRIATNGRFDQQRYSAVGYQPAGGLQAHGRRGRRRACSRAL